MTRKASRLNAETFTHTEKRRNIPTAEYGSLVDDATKTPLEVAYERRNRDLDPQLVWRGKDEHCSLPQNFTGSAVNLRYKHAAHRQDRRIVVLIASH